MGLLTIFSKTPKADVKRQASGSFTVSPDGRIVSSTVPATVSAALVREIGRNVLAIFDGAHKANLQFTELVVQYAAYKITARQMRGGAIVFLSPKTLQTVPTL
jgi:hypothetical protein